LEAKKFDRRVNRTRRQLRQALMTLVLVKGLDAVTIEDITNEADVGRTTFYLHYKDKEDLLFECINTTIEDLVTQVSDIPILEWQLSGNEHQEEISARNPILNIFQHVAENANLYRIIIRGGSTSQTQNRVRDIIADAVSTFLCGRVEDEHLIMNPIIPLEVFASYFAGALMGIITWWLDIDMVYTPLEMTRMFQKLFFPGARNVLGISFP
jgi:AcrR family transcriptional regulator